MASATKSREELVLQEHYAELVDTLSRSIDQILRGLVSRRVINITDKNNIKKYGDMPEDRAEYLLDRYMDRSLAAGINDNLMKLLQVMKEIPECKPLAVTVEQDLTGAPTATRADDVDGEENKAIDELTERIKRLENVTSIHSQEEIHKERSTAPTAKVQQPVADSDVDIFKKDVKWKELPPLPVGLDLPTAVLLGGNIYVGAYFEGESGFDFDESYTIHAYNLTTNQWSPSSITTPYFSFAMTVLDDKLVTAGGIAKNDEVVKKVLVFNAGQWEDYSEMPTARYAATAVGYHSMLIVVGGAIKMEVDPINMTVPIGSIVSATELLDTTNGCWYACNNLPTPLQDLKAVIMKDKLYLLGGSDDNMESLPQMFVASLDTLSIHQLNWQSAPDTPYRLSSAVVLHNKFLLTVGGEYEECTSDVNVYIPSTGEWKYLTNIPEARKSSAVVGVADSIIVIGGMNDDQEHSKTVWVGVFE